MFNSIKYLFIYFLILVVYKYDNETKYLGFPLCHALFLMGQDSFTVVGFLVDFSLFSQIRDGLGVGSNIITPAPS